MKSMTLSAVAFRSVKVSQIQTVLFSKSPPQQVEGRSRRASGSHAGGIGTFAIGCVALRVWNGFRVSYAHLR